MYFIRGSRVFTYDKLWKILKERGIKKVDLRDEIGITPSTLAKLSKNQNVSMEVLNRICTYLECDIGDILEHTFTPYKDDSTLGTFLPNKKEILHNWFGYLEGYSKTLVESELEKLDNIQSVYDPFSGSGTTPLVSVMNGIDGYYTESNPVMAFISRVKTKTAFIVAGDKKLLSEFDKAINDIDSMLSEIPLFEEPLFDFGGFEKYFEDENLRYIQKYITYINSHPLEEEIKDLLKVGLAGVAVDVSKMIRRGDLRYAKGKELSKVNKPFPTEIINKLNLMKSDLEAIPSNINLGKSTFLDYDVRDIKEVNLVDAIITSPPYLNGTNYIRNTKLELKLLGFIETEEELSELHKKGIVAGINNVSKNADKNYEPLQEIKALYDELVEVSYDKRIPKMIAAYFNDMQDVFNKLSQILKDKGKLILDIGDSQFAGVHVKTHDILKIIAEKYGFNIYSEEIIRTRKSRSGFDLTQRILRFELTKEDNNDLYLETAKSFMDNQEYKETGRNWGNSWHSLCSYRGKLKPAIAAELVQKFSNPGDRVLDPMGGVGTIPLEANLQGRVGISNDLSKFAWIVASAKLNPPVYEDIIAEMDKLEKYIEEEKEKHRNNEEIHNFGLNKVIADYYHPDTMVEILAAREYFSKDSYSPAEFLIISAILHILHGNRPYALSRNSHPLTPYAPTGDFIYKNLIDRAWDKINRSYNAKDFYHWNNGESYQVDAINLHDHLENKVDVIITSPPFASSFKFYTQNWLRLWFAGWKPEDFKEAGEVYFDDKQNKDLDIYYDYFESCHKVLKDNGKLILHLGKSKKINMAKELILRSEKWFELVYTDDEDVSNIENHGVSDKGSTTDHQFVFLRKK